MAANKGNGPGAWTKERDAEAKRLFLEGQSATQIANVLGGLTRSAVIGRLSRLGVKRSDAGLVTRVIGTSRRRGAQIAAPVNTGVIVMALLPPKPIPAERPHTGPVVSIMALGRGVCRWPCGDPRDARFGYCGARTAVAADDEAPVYCPTHRKLGTVPNAPKMRKRRAAA